MDISFDYYKIFYEVAKAKSISLAAQYLCLTQPTITKYIQNLEQELHCKLFVRSRKGVSLTAEGQMLLRQVSRAVQQMERAGGMLQEFVNCQSGKINIGASELTMRYYLLPYLEQFRQQFPNVNLQIHAFSTPVSLSALNAGTIDFTVSITPIEGAEHFTVTRVSDFQDIVIAGSQYTLWDDELNQLWAHLKDSLDTETMDTLTQEQLQWIQDRDAQIDAASADFQGGTGEPMVRSLTGASLTRERVYVLKEYIQ